MTTTMEVFLREETVEMMIGVAPPREDDDVGGSRCGGPSGGDATGGGGAFGGRRGSKKRTRGGGRRTGGGGGGEEDEGSSRCAAAAHHSDGAATALPFCRRPRCLYLTLFVWLSVCSGRFLATFLERSCYMSNTQIGLALAAQQVASTAAGAWGGAFADAWQRRNSNGRALAMGLGVVAGTLVFLMHGFVSRISHFLASDGWAFYVHVALRCIYAVTSSLVCPVLDGMTVDYLKKKKRGTGGPKNSSSKTKSAGTGASGGVDELAACSSGGGPTNRNRNKANAEASAAAATKSNKDEDEYGRERLYGAVGWAATNLAFAAMLDARGGGFWIAYPCTAASCIGVLASLVAYSTGGSSVGGDDGGGDDDDDDFDASSRSSFQCRALEKRSSDVIKPDDDLEEVVVGGNECGDSVREGLQIATTASSSSPSSKEEVPATAAACDDDPLSPLSCSDDAQQEQQQQQQQQERLHPPSSSSSSPPAVPMFTILKMLVSSSPNDDGRGKNCSTAAGIPYLFCLFCLSIGMILVESLIFLYFEFLGSSYLVMGYTVVLTVVFEIPIFHMAPALLLRWGTGNLLLLASACYVVRVVGYSVIPEGRIWLVLFLEPLHGVTYACCQTSMVAYAAAVASALQLQEAQSQRQREGAAGAAEGSNAAVSYEASTQALLQWFKGCGSTAGLLLGGYASDTIGPRLMYRVAAAVVTVGAGTLLLLSPQARKKSDAATADDIAACRNQDEFDRCNNESCLEDGDIELSETYEGSSVSVEEEIQVLLED